MSIKAGKRSILFTCVNSTVMILLMLITAYPIFYVMIASITDPAELMAKTGFLFWPKKFSFESYRLLLQYPLLLISYKNTVLYVLVGTFISLSVTTLGGYALSRREVPGVKVIMFFITLTMFFTGGLIPRYLLMNDLNIIDSIWAIVLPSAVSTMNLIIMRTSFIGMPKSLEESAKIDGAGDFKVLFSIIIPLSKPIIAVMSLFYAVYYWNDFFTAMIYIKTREKFPLQLLLRELLITNSTDEVTADMGSEKTFISQVIKYSTIIVSTVPILLVYPFLQRYFTKGVMIGAIKG